MLTDEQRLELENEVERLSTSEILTPAERWHCIHRFYDYMVKRNRAEHEHEKQCYFGTYPRG